MHPREGRALHTNLLMMHTTHRGVRGTAGHRSRSTTPLGEGGEPPGGVAASSWSSSPLGKGARATGLGAAQDLVLPLLICPAPPTTLQNSPQPAARPLSPSPSASARGQVHAVGGGRVNAATAPAGVVPRPRRRWWGAGGATPLTVPSATPPSPSRPPRRRSHTPQGSHARPDVEGDRAGTAVDVRGRRRRLRPPPPPRPSGARSPGGAGRGPVPSPVEERRQPPLGRAASPARQPSRPSPVGGGVGVAPPGRRRPSRRRAAGGGGRGGGMGTGGRSRGCAAGAAVGRPVAAQQGMAGWGQGWRDGG